MTRPVHVVVVAFNAPGSLARCLTSLGGAFPTTVVDNSGSSDVAEIAVEHGARYIDPACNLGFAAAVNVALVELVKGSPTDVLLLNPDAILEIGEIEKLVRCLRVGPERVGAAAPRLLGPDGTEQRGVWPFPSPLRAWVEAIGLGSVRVRETFAVGAALLLRWEALQEVGLFDERFFLYAEEADWQRRALALGWTTRLCREAVGFHVGAGASSDPIRREALFHAGQETYIRKWYGATGWCVYRVAAVAGAMIRATLLVSERRAEAARRAVLYARGPRRCAGIVRSM